MKIYDIDELIINNGVVDLTQTTFKYQVDVTSTRTYTVQRGEEMRIDLISDSIYDNIDNIDILCNYNNIDNPLNFKEGEVIKFPDESYIPNLRWTDPVITDSEVINKSPSKTTRKDTSRKDYIDNNKSLTPTQLSRRISPLNTGSDQLSIGDGLF
jgi:hypothetical protein